MPPALSKQLVRSTPQSTLWCLRAYLSCVSRCCKRYPCSRALLPCQWVLSALQPRLRRARHARIVAARLLARAVRHEPLLGRGLPCEAGGGAWFGLHMMWSRRRNYIGCGDDMSLDDRTVCGDHMVCGDLKARRDRMPHRLQRLHILRQLHGLRRPKSAATACVLRTTSVSVISWVTAIR